MADCILSMEHITKVYPNGFVANRDVSLQVQKGEVHALSGENGAGKSTLMKVLFGEEQPESGRIVFEGREIRPEDPISAIRLGIGMVHQHFMLVDSLSVAENIVLGLEPGRFGRFDKREAFRRAAEIIEKYRFSIDARRPVGSLPVGDRQKVEILKALYRGAKLLILDEPTAVLTPQETEELFLQIEQLKAQGHTLIFISHKLREIKQICEHITVLRGGRTVGTARVADVSEQEISRMMVGRDVLLEIDKPPARPGRTVLSVRGVPLSDRPDAPEVSFDLRAGEILGIAGVEGNGQSELCSRLAGLLPVRRGQVRLDGQDIAGRSVRALRALGMSHISEDRMTYGCAADANVEENLFSTTIYQKAYSRFGLLRRKLLDRRADELIREFCIKCTEKKEPVRMLSGGNIQKVVVAREFSGEPKCILANQPTRGIDVGATEFIRNRLLELRSRGAAVLLVSADLNEVLELSDRLLVFAASGVSAYFPDAAAVDEETLGEYMLDLRQMTAQEIGGAVYETS
ncbi:MAG TPA: ABC transporter ATP-binding protein [Candidatus Fimenecus excrementigallinarum]|uniref:ABC transporter ATP-binding protein n=1 Tax=Candidatus Fimenecus excrementigallinarum TaxID=2840816 RepID=A0A9D1IER3_9FIRM|nr:ABC transporter ATP-binding protein [Candidatus Fimenecus excrementigallinarum]